MHKYKKIFFKKYKEEIENYDNNIKKILITKIILDILFLNKKLVKNNIKVY